LEQRRISYQRVDPEVQQSLMRRADEVGPMVELNDLKACDRFDVMGQVDQIQLPTLAICGSDDIMTPVRYSDYLVEKIDGARRDVIEGGTHFVQLEQPQAVNRQIEMFLSALR
jgi:pimeloyl-ACP methyl ester carboxylesterase